ncbi:hypothetical protein [Streptomyces profundus]|uniref:hypothetical protein n=1 Tax=Streptomyces profundus TaxID=2867410 RepID=UPI001D15E966|nr:hypothetical protein [Streptomyces sp. MA3_2.13]UED85373.1 hypothetical protein K4G22_15170 [Streptomyces sp. MA3_2.13]
MAYHSLAPTGAGLALGGIALGQVWFVVGALALVLAGALLVRTTFRRGKSAHEV